MCRVLVVALENRIEKENTESVGVRTSAAFTCVAECDCECTAVWLSLDDNVCEQLARLEPEKRESFLSCSGRQAKSFEK